MSSVTSLFIGDPHFQLTNLTEVDLFMKKIVELVLVKKPDIIIIAGDLLHTHERLHTTVLNKAYEFVNEMRLITKTYVLVGNHDYISNSQFLNDNHWMNSMKEWENTVIVDRVIHETINGVNFVMTPYVYPGRFVEALSTIGDVWKTCDCIFAHQEFEGCKMGAITSIEGDKWSLDYPIVVSGHIHNKQWPQKNIYYAGTPFQHAFGDSDRKTVAFMKFQAQTEYVLEEIELDLPKKKIVYMDVDDIEKYNATSADEKVRITVSGNYEQFKALKKTKKFKDMTGKGVKICFKPDKPIEIQSTAITSTGDFSTVLNTLVLNKKDPYLIQAYDLVLFGKKTNPLDVFFL